jgi:hypothetical protein
VNGPDHYREESVKALNDVFHAAKSMGRQALKIASTYVGILEQKLKVALPLIEISDEGDLSETFLDPLLSSLMSNFTRHFNDIADKFDASGASDWVKASSS